MTKLLFALVTLSVLATAIPAKAGQCVTTCTPTYGGGSRCTTQCY
jgi:hypothetical protein